LRHPVTGITTRPDLVKETSRPPKRRRSNAGCGPTPGFIVHSTRTAGSWLNLVERAGLNRRR